MKSIQEEFLIGNGRANRKPLNMMDLLQIVRRRKNLLIGLTLGGLLAGLLYTLLVSPVYEASTLIKKEKAGNEGTQDNLSKIVALQTFDDLETEIEILKTRTVLEKVIDDLSLNFFVQKIGHISEPDQQLKMPLIEYRQQHVRFSNGHLPDIDILRSKIPPAFEGRDYYVEVLENGNLTLVDAQTGSRHGMAPSPADFKQPHFHISVFWPGAEPGSRLRFRVRSPQETMKDLSNSISVTPMDNTSIFRVAVKSSSPFMAQLKTNTLAEKFREARYEQKQQGISSSFEFADQQLNEISAKLREAEADLSNFKSENQIVVIDQASQKTVEFLSELEAEKVRTDLEVAEFQNKYAALQNELASKGFFDQTYLAPSHNDRRESPFASLLQQLSDAELERLRLMQRRTEQHPDVLILTDQIRQIKERLASYNQNTIAAYNVLLQTRTRKQQALAELIDSYSAKVQNLPENEILLVRLMRNKNVYEKVFNLLLNKREEMRLARLSKLQDIVVVDPAYLPMEAVSPHLPLSILAGTFLGLLLAIVLIFTKEFQSNTVQNLDELEEASEIPILAIFPRYKRSLLNKIKEGFYLTNHFSIIRHPGMGFMESYRLMRTRLMQLPAERNTIFFTSCEENTGKTTVVTMFAITLALAGKKVLLIDGDLKKSTLTNFFQLPESDKGLIPYLKGETSTPQLYSICFQSENEEFVLPILPCGGTTQRSSELLESEAFQDYLEAVSQEYDYVLIDTPPVTQAVDSLILGNYIKDAILIVRPNLTLKKRIRRALEEFERLNTSILGFVVNAHDADPGQNGYAYGYGPDAYQDLRAYDTEMMHYPDNGREIR